MEIKYFRLIKTIVAEGSIANSSKKLFLTQSAISHQLKELEEQLGFKVFHRTRNAWKLTEEGIELHALGISILASIDKSFENIAQIRAGSVGHIKVSTECYSFYQGLPTFIQKMGLLYPDITVDLLLEATHHPITKLLSKELDIAIVTTKPDDNSLTCIPFFEDEIFLVMHAENTLSTLPYVTATDFLDIHLLIHSFPIETVAVYTHFLKPNRILPPRISAIPLTEVALAMVQANLGVLSMPKWAMQSFKPPTNLVLKKIGENGLKRHHYLVIRTSDTSKKYIQDFISSFTAHFILDHSFPTAY